MLHSDKLHHTSSRLCRYGFCLNKNNTPCPSLPPSLPPSLHMAADIWRKAISCERKGACPLLVICRWSWHKWWKSLYKYMRLETLRRGTTLKIHETPVLQSQMFSLPIHPAWMLSDCRMAFILEFAHFVRWRVCTHACYSCHSRQLLSRIDCCQAAWSLGRQTPSIPADKTSAVSVRAINIPSAGCSPSVALALSQRSTSRSSELIRKSSARLPLQNTNVRR